MPKFERSGLGQLQIELSDESSWQSVEGSYHHIGTTRMSINPRQVSSTSIVKFTGLVTYIAGSSVFPTSGLSNPTLTICALAIRLADHIKAKYSGQELDKIAFQ